jgi:hypothetical protein
MEGLTVRQNVIGNARFLLESAATDNKNTRSRMAKYIAWLDGDGSNEFTKNWLQPDLADWRDALAFVTFCTNKPGSAVQSRRRIKRRS